MLNVTINIIYYAGMVWLISLFLPSWKASGNHIKIINLNHSQKRHMNPVEKALELRKSLRLRSKQPETAFVRRLRWPRSIMRCVEQHERNGGLLNEARRQYAVSLCAAYEIYWRDFLKQTIDVQRFGAFEIRRLRNHKFTFPDLQQILGKRLTLGEIVACSYTFQGTEVINQVCQDIFRLDLFAIMGKVRFKIEIAEPKTEAQAKPAYLKGVDILKSRQAVDRCFAVRHETVHNTGTRFRLSPKDLNKIERSMSSFNFFSSIILEEELEKTT